VCSSHDGTIGTCGSATDASAPDASSDAGSRPDSAQFDAGATDDATTPHDGAPPEGAIGQRSEAGDPPLDDTGVFGGDGISCSTSPSSPGSTAFLVGLAATLVGLARRRRDKS
jgi:MYXO-CTERM domain-containing protein